MPKFFSKHSSENKLKIGEHLVAEKVVSRDDIEEALNYQKQSNSKIGAILQSKGVISAYKFYRELAKLKNYEFIELSDYEVDLTLIDLESRQEFLDKDYLPLYYDDEGYLLIALCNFEQDIIDFLKQKYGEKIKIYATSPFDILWKLQYIFSDDDIQDASERLYNISPEQSSKTEGSIASRLFRLKLILFVALIVHVSITAPNGFILFTNVVFLIAMLAKIFFFSSRGSYSHNRMDSSQYLSLQDKDLPVYSILCPMYKEAEITISNLINNIRNLSYPLEKLDIKLIVEKDDASTISLIKSLQPPSNFQIIYVEESLPRTKPKACNYALRFCKGDFVTIYDAEDRPDKYQLKKVIAKFNEDSSLSCVQAKLNYYNRSENILTKFFAIEYSCWFDYMLLGLQRLNIPIPLGGTSNHFRVAFLRKMHGWDPYNVTEDADLGIRIAKLGFHTEILDSYTMEEAPVDMVDWYKQRTRWIKGYMQTFSVHTRNAVKLFTSLKFSALLGFFFFIAMPFIIFLSAPLVFLFASYTFYNADLEVYNIVFSMANLIFALVVHIFMALIVCRDNKWQGMTLSIAFYPVYWLLHHIAAYNALYELVKKPHYWAKTTHGKSSMLSNS